MRVQGEGLREVGKGGGGGWGWAEGGGGGCTRNTSVRAGLVEAGLLHGRGGRNIAGHAGELWAEVWVWVAMQGKGKLGGDTGGQCMRHPEAAGTRGQETPP